jgi:hypothetical protein
MEMQCKDWQVARVEANRPEHYDSPDNNAWTRANLGMPPEPGDPGYEEYMADTLELRWEIEKLKAEIERLNRIEQAAREFISHLQYPQDNITHSSKQLEKLRSALGMDK